MIDLKSNSQSGWDIQIFLVFYALYEYMHSLTIVFVSEDVTLLRSISFTSIFPIILLIGIVYEKKELFNIYLLFNMLKIAVLTFLSLFCAYLAVKMPEEYVIEAIKLFPSTVHDKYEACLLVTLLAIAFAAFALIALTVRLSIYRLIGKVDAIEQDNKWRNLKHYNTAQ